MYPQTRQYYDEAFAEVFTNRKIIESMLRDFVKDQWVEMIDFSSLSIEKSVFKGISDSKRESDLLLKFDINNERKGELLLFILLEFQSKPDAMILRLLEYLTRIYRRQYTDLKKLYPVVPIVIYNGKTPWKEKDRFLDNLEIWTGDMKQYIPDFRYILIDIASFDDSILEELKDAVSYFFLLDKTDLSERDKAAERILTILRNLHRADPEVFKLLGRYITGLLRFRSLEINEINDYLTDRSRREGMLAQSLEELYEEGRVKGLEQGIEQSNETTKRDIFLRQFEIKFYISEADRQLVLSSEDIKVIDEALDRIIFATTAEEVLSLFRKE